MDVVAVAVTPVTPHPTALVQNEIVAVAVVTARLPNLPNSSNGIRGACVTAALLARIPYERVEVQIVAVAVSQRSSGSGFDEYVGLRSGPMLIKDEAWVSNGQ